MLQALGRLHPLLVHFPIALLLVALLVELRRPRSAGPSEAGFLCLLLGTLGALTAAGSGWLFAAWDPPGMPRTLLWHRWSGVGSAGMALVTLVSAWRWRRHADPRLAQPTRAGLLFTAILVGLAGWFGGEMVYGEGFLWEPFKGGLLREEPPEAALPAASLDPEPERPPTAAGPAPEPADPPADAGPKPVDYLSEIRPLFERSCYECHGERKRPKGQLRLSDLASVLARAPSEAAIVPGRPEESLLYRRITLPAEDEDRMPPEGDPLAPEEIELVRHWIAEGAHWEAAPAPAGAETEGAPDDGPPPPALDESQRATRDAALELLQVRGLRAQRVATESDAVEVDFGVAASPCGDAELELLAGLEPCLVELSLARSAVTDAGLARLSGFHALRRLRLEHTAVGDEGLAHLAGLARLESLVLFDTRVGDGAVAVLEGLPRLARLYTGDSRLGDAALDELGRARPELVIERGRLPAEGGKR